MVENGAVHSDADFVDRGIGTHHALHCPVCDVGICDADQEIDSLDPKQTEVRMKTIKRIIAVLLLIVILLAVGYLSFTGSRLQEMRDDAAEVTAYEETNLS